MTAQTQWYRSAIVFGYLGVLPTYPGAMLECPENFAIPPLMGNYWAVNYGPGLKQPFLTCQFAIRDTSADDILAGTVGGNYNSPAGLLDYLFSRSNDCAHNTPSLGTMEFWDCRSRVVMENAKADAFQLSGSKGSDMLLSVRFCGTSCDMDTTTPTGLTGFTGWHDANILRFPSVNFTDEFEDIVWSFNMSYTNSHNPDLSLEGSEFPSSCDAGQKVASMALVVQAADGLSNSQNGPVANGGDINLQISGTGRSLTLTMPNVLNTTPRNRSIAIPRTMRAYQYYCLGGDGTTIPPLYLSAISGF